MQKVIKINLIEKFIKKNKLTKKEFCNICKISEGTLNKILKNNSNFKITAVFKVARVLKIRICELFE